MRGPGTSIGVDRRAPPEPDARPFCDAGAVGLFRGEALRVPGAARLPCGFGCRGERKPHHVEYYLVRTPGGEVPLDQIASPGFSRSSAAIHRVDGRRAVTITAEREPADATGQQVNAKLENGSRTTEGENPISATLPRSERGAGSRDRRTGPFTILVSLIMYSLMAIPFGSYTQPLNHQWPRSAGRVGALPPHAAVSQLGPVSLTGWSASSALVVNDS